MRRVFFCIFREVKKKGEGLPEVLPGNFFSPLSCFPLAYFSCVLLFFHSSRSYFLVSLWSGHDLIITTPSRFMYNMHNILPSPVLHLPTTTSPFFCLVLPSTVLRGHIFCARALFLRVDTARLRLASCGKRKGVWLKR